jgi:phage terminase large subunit GpA-like protein
VPAPVAVKDLGHLSAWQLLAHCAGDLIPAERLSLPEFSVNHRFLPGQGGGRGDRWSNDITPYLVEPMEAADGTFGNITTVLVGPGQIGKTVVPENWLLKSVINDPANMLWYMQSIDSLEAYVKDRINPMIDDHDEMARLKGLRPIDDSIGYKRFRGMSVQFLTASARNLINKSAPRIVADEIDAYPTNLGDVKVQLDIRRQRFIPNSMLVALSHCDLARGLDPEKDWGAGIMSMYADSTRCIWYWECPQCQLFSSPNPMADKVMDITCDPGLYKEGSLDEIERQAVLQCPHNGCAIEDKHRRAMNLTGLWIGAGQMIDKHGRIKGQRIKHNTCGYWLVGAMSPFVSGGIGGLLRAKVKAERERDQTDDDKTLREVIVKMWGIPYTPQRPIGSIEVKDLIARADPDFKPGTVPDGCRFITISVDCQISTFEYLVRGFGVGTESWTIEKGRFLADPATNPEDWDKLLDLYGRGFPLADGSGRTMVARAGSFDSQGAPGVTAQAYAAWMRWRKAKKLSMYGMIGGREAWSIIGTRGANTLQAPLLQIIYPDTARKASALIARGEVPIALFNPNLFKDMLAGQLLKGEAGPGYVNIPADFKSKTPPHLWFEQLVSERRLLNGRWEKLSPNMRNEALDLMAMTHVVAHLHGLPRINWDKPPPWAAPWDKNPLVTAAAAQNASGETVKPKPRGGVLKVTIDPTTKKSISSKIA